MGHYSNECPSKTGIQLLMAGVESDEFDDNEYYGASSSQVVNILSEGMTFHQEEQVLTKSWILLDNQSTVDVFCNRRLLTNVREIDKVMNIRCNAGVTRTNMVRHRVVQPEGDCKHPVVVSSREETPCDVRQRSVKSICGTQK